MRLPTVKDLKKFTFQQLANQTVRSVYDPGVHEVLMAEIEDSSVAGSTNDAVFRFKAANDVVVGTAMSVVRSATLGDSVKIVDRGLYLAQLTFSQAASSTVHLGISLNGQTLNANPALSVTGMRAVHRSTLPVATTTYIHLSAIIPVTEALAAVEGGAVVRFHGTDGSGAVVANATIDVNTECTGRVIRISDYLS